MFPLKVEIPFPTKQELDRFKKFLLKTGRKRGPWVYLLIKEGLRREESAIKGAEGAA